MFENRTEAGLLLASKLLPYKSKKNTVVLGIPRGGVVTAKVVSRKLNLPLDIIVTRKIGAPYQEELAIGAVGTGGVAVLDKDLIQRLGVDDAYIKKVISKKRKEIRERLKKFRGTRKTVNLKDKTVILVDDGIATGATVEAATKYLKKEKVRKIVLATPVAPADTFERLKKFVNEAFVLQTPTFFHAVGQFYQDFPQVTDEEVVQSLRA